MDILLHRDLISHVYIYSFHFYCFDICHIMKSAFFFGKLYLLLKMIYEHKLIQKNVVFYQLSVGFIQKTIKDKKTMLCLENI